MEASGGEFAEDVRALSQRVAKAARRSGVAGCDLAGDEETLSGELREKALTQKQLLLREIVSTEANYVRCLTSLTEEYLHPLMDSGYSAKGVHTHTHNTRAASVGEETCATRRGYFFGGTTHTRSGAGPGEARAIVAWGVGAVYRGLWDGWGGRILRVAGSQPSWHTVWCVWLLHTHTHTHTV